MPTTHVSKETCLHFVKGSHRWGKWFHPKKFASHLGYNVEDDIIFFEYEDVPDVEKEGYDILSWELEVKIFLYYFAWNFGYFASICIKFSYGKQTF